jgi:tRNA U34 2-thiouridine synthase MnmA/TrmU
MNKKWYVIKIDYKKNAIIVGEEKDLYKKEVIITNSVWYPNFNINIFKSNSNLLSDSLY